MLWNIWNVLSGAVTMLCFYSLVFALTRKESLDNKEQKPNTIKLDFLEKYQGYILLFALSILLVTSIFFIWRRNHVLLLVFSAFYLILLVERLLNSSDIVFEMVFAEPETKSKVSINKYIQVLYFCGILMALIASPIGSLKKFVDFVIDSEWNVYVKSVSISLILLSYFSVIVFSGLISLALPVRQIEKIVLRIKQQQPIIKSFWYIFHNKIIGGRLINIIAKDKRIWKKILFSLLLPASILVDLITHVVGIIVYMIINILMIAAKTVLWILKIIGIMIRYVYRNSFDTLVSYSFRVSFVISIIVLICFFRFRNPFGFPDNYLSVFEYMSSVIVIPIIFDWIFAKKQIINESKTVK